MEYLSADVRQIVCVSPAGVVVGVPSATPAAALAAAGSSITPFEIPFAAESAAKKKPTGLVYVTLPRFLKSAKCIVERIRDVLSSAALPGGTKNGAAEKLLRKTDIVPCIPKQLTDEQSAAAHHMLNSPLTIIMGPPGRGKTCLIEFAMALWKNVCVVSFVGTVVAGHRRRMNNRLECSNTAHHLYKSALASPQGTQWASSFEELVWDEFSNVEDSLFCKTLQVLKNLKRLVLVLDPYQIQPLGTGSPAIDLIDAFPRNCFTLTTNMRVNPRSRELADAVLYIMKDQPRNIHWSYDILEKASMTLLDAPICTSSQDCSDVSFNQDFGI